MSKPVYLDHHATTPVEKEVMQAMEPYFSELYGNPSSKDNYFGNKALSLLSEQRRKLAQLINAHDEEEIIFTSGATESDNIALLGFARANKKKGNHIITTKVEHKAILESAKQLEKEGFDITYLDVDENGNIDLNDLKKTIKPNTILISIIAANNEIGTVSPLSKIGRITKDHNVVFHTDAAQAFGNIPLDMQEMNIDMMSISSHKIYGPKGVGALFLRRENPYINVEPIMYGGGQEFGIRPGTHNLSGIVGFVKASEIAVRDLDKNILKLKSLRDKLYQKISDKVQVEVNGTLTHRLPNNLNLFFEGVDAKALVNTVHKDIALSTGSACTTAEVKPSHVITALGYDSERAHCSVRIGIGRHTTLEDIEKTSDSIVKAVMHLRGI